MSHFGQVLHRYNSCCNYATAGAYVTFPLDIMRICHNIPHPATGAPPCDGDEKTLAPGFVDRGHFSRGKRHQRGEKPVGEAVCELDARDTDVGLTAS